MAEKPLLRILLIGLCLIPSLADAGTIKITDSNSAKVLVLGKGLACFSEARLLGTLKGEVFRTLKPGAKIKQLKTRLAFLRSKKSRRLLAARIKAIKAAVRACAAWRPSSSSTSQGSQSSQSSARSVTLLSSISRHGITWTFDKEYPAGQFVNGDWWVVGPVTVKAINPDPTGGRNGAVINPMPGSAQGYDSRLYDYEPSLSRTPPFILSENQSLVSAISHDNTDTHKDLMGVPIRLEHAYLKSASILTCLAEPPSPQSFRPPYVGESKRLYSSSLLRAYALPTLAPVDNTPELAQYERYFERPWLDHKNGWTGRLMHPTENMPNYGREIAGVVGDATLLLTLNFTPAQKETLLRGVVQAGIDMYGIARLDKHTWEPGGGHGLGRKWLIVFAGQQLRESDFWTMNDYWSSEDGNTYFADGRGGLWTGWQNSGHQYAANVLWGMYHGIPGREIADHEHIHPRYWGSIPFPYNGQYPYDKFEPYKRTCSPTHRST